MERIKATQVLFGSDDETHWTQWLWPQGGIDFEQGYLVLERTAEPEDEDANRVWASRCGQRYSCYDGVEQVTLWRSEIRVEFNNHGKNKLDCDDLVIEFIIQDAEFAGLSEVMQSVLDGRVRFVKHAEQGAAAEGGS
jgi:hypothetical protein